MYSLNKAKVPGIFQFIHRNKNFVLCTNESSLKERKPQFFTVRNMVAVAFPTTLVEEAPTDEKPVLTDKEKAKVDWFLHRKPIPLEFWKLPRVAGLNFFFEEAPEILRQGKGPSVTSSWLAGGLPQPF